ncbi:Ig-like domain-containing protein [Brevibacillus agri]|uniref:Ig-like domain-containing protein n=1 Tax=Brevibacillus agri TaxID=51101 RepID=UPI001EE5CEC9|nr:Ig-like domain-containing protein [Brevibacillus agri]MCG5251390.1 Ig-like domain-containing protein [Brevibacillus agri]WHX30717.1 Ig-like domain-containing protein [Brevibacillus agri]
MSARRLWMQWIAVLGMLLAFSQAAWAKDASNWKISVSPTDKATEVAADAVITLTFSGTVRLANSRDITDKSLLSIVQLVDEKKKKVPFTAKWNKTARSIVIDPVGNLEAGKAYRVTLLAKKLKDARGELNPELSAAFTTKKPVDNIAPQAIILPGHGAKQVKLEEKVTLQFAEEVTLASGGALSSKTAAGLVRLTDEKGQAVPHTVTWNKSKRMLSIKPKGKWQPHTSYQVSLAGGLLQDQAGNVNKSQWSSFTSGAK